MANIDLKFIDKENFNDYIQVKKYGNFISILGSDRNLMFCIELDKSTAIKFAKTLRTEINKIKEV